MREDIFVEGQYQNTSIPDTVFYEKVIPPQVSQSAGGFASKLNSMMDMVSVTMVPGTILLNLFL